MNYRYTIQIRETSSAVRDATAEEVAALPMIGDWRSAADLPDGTEFAYAFNGAYQGVVVYRIADDPERPIA